MLAWSTPRQDTSTLLFRCLRIHIQPLPAPAQPLHARVFCHTLTIQRALPWQCQGYEKKETSRHPRAHCATAHPTGSKSARTAPQRLSRPCPRCSCKDVAKPPRLLASRFHQQLQLVIHPSITLRQFGAVVDIAKVMAASPSVASSTSRRSHRLAHNEDDDETHHRKGRWAAATRRGFYPAPHRFTSA